MFNVKRTIFQLYLWEQVYKQTNSVGRKVTLGLDFECMSRLSQERYWMLDSIGKFCFAPGHQHYLLKTFGFSTENDILHIRGIDLYPDRRESRVFDSSCTITWRPLQRGCIPTSSETKFYFYTRVVFVFCFCIYVFCFLWVGVGYCFLWVGVGYCRNTFKKSLKITTGYMVFIF